MAECIAQQALDFHPQLPVRVEYDAPEISSDGGTLLLRAVDDHLELTAGFSACLPDARDPRRVRHARLEQSRQRIYQIALGYEDCNDADSLRFDPLLKTACDRTPSDPVGLSSQPTLSRFENAPDGLTIRRLIRWYEDSYVASLPDDLDVLILDIDATDDETHGQQQLSFFHGYYDHHMYHPLMVFDAQTGELITAVLRPGNTHASRGAQGVLRRLVRKLKERFPQLQIVVRGDAGFAMPKLMLELERLHAELGDIYYVFGIAKNAVLKRLAATEMEWAAELFEIWRDRIQRFTSFRYAARSWPKERRIVAKAEHSVRGANPRFVVTSIEGFEPEMIYRAYCQRGQCENWIKDFKNAIQADRLSCCSFTANFFRLLLHLAAYRLMHALRRQVATVSTELGHCQFDTLRLRLLRVAALVRQTTRWIWVRLPKAYPFRSLFSALLGQLNAPPALA